MIIGGILTVLIVFLFLNSWRSTVITGLTLPVSVIAAFLAIYAFGFTLNCMTLMALSLAIGILIDDAIVVRENIVRHVERGEDHIDGRPRGHQRDRPRGAGHDPHHHRVFVPVAFMGGIVGRFFCEFGITVACAVLVSPVRLVHARPDALLALVRPRRGGHHRDLWAARCERFNRGFVDIGASATGG